MSTALQQCSTTLHIELVENLGDKERPWIEMAISGLAQLTPRERDVASLLAISYSHKGIAERLDLKPKSVQLYVNRIYGKLGLNQLELEEPALRKVSILNKALLLSGL